jgi:uncharacterized protein (DUF433 family)
VHGLGEWRKLGLSDAGILEAHPDLTLADLEAAWEYHRVHAAEIERAIKENDEA